MADIKVEGHPDLVRRGAAIVNVDRSAYEAYVSQRRAHQERENRIKALEDEVASIKEGVGQVLELLKGMQK